MIDKDSKYVLFCVYSSYVVISKDTSYIKFTVSLDQYILLTLDSIKYGSAVARAVSGAAFRGRIYAITD